MKSPPMKNWYGLFAWVIGLSTSGIQGLSGYDCCAEYVKLARFHPTATNQDHGAHACGQNEYMVHSCNRPFWKEISTSRPLHPGAMNFPDRETKRGTDDVYPRSKVCLGQDALVRLHPSSEAGLSGKNDTCPAVAGTFGNLGNSDRKHGFPDGARTPSPCLGGPDEAIHEVHSEDQKAVEQVIRAVEFQTGSARLQPRALQILDQIVIVLKQFPEMHLSIEGHTDSVGGELQNQALSLQRAAVCKTYFAMKGIDPERLGTAGYGESKPLDSNDTALGRQKNRRTEFIPISR